MKLTMLLGFIIVAISVAVLLMPNKWINTVSCKRNWVVIVFILMGAMLIIGDVHNAFWLLVILCLGILANYTFPFLLNVLKAFNWKSDP